MEKKRNFTVRKDSEVGEKDGGKEEGKRDKEGKDEENRRGDGGDHGQEILFPWMFSVAYIFKLYPTSCFFSPHNNVTVL